jgi:hypothetical protein
MALAEVIVSATVLLLMLGLVTLALTGYLRGSHQLLDQDFPADAMARSLERVSRHLRSTQSVVWPPPAARSDYQPVRPETPPLVLQVRGEGALGLTVDPAHQRLLEIHYGGAFDAADPYPASAKVRELGPCSDLRFHFQEEQVLVVLGAGPRELPWSTGVVLP